MKKSLIYGVATAGVMMFMSGCGQITTLYGMGLPNVVEMDASDAVSKTTEKIPTTVNDNSENNSIVAEESEPDDLVIPAIYGPGL